jgi:L-galactose dehydrogenase
MKYTSLGNTDLRVSAIGLGTGPLGELFGPVDERLAMRIVGEALDHGITFFDTAPYYESAEDRLGKALRGRRDDVVVATKAGRYGHDDFDFSAGRIRAGLEESLRRLHTDHVDVLFLHDIEFAPLDDVLTEGYEEAVRLRDSGKCRYIGVTGYSLPALKRAMTETELDVVLTYAHGTLLDDSITTELLPLADERGVGVINAAAVALGLLTRKSHWYRRDLLPDGTVKRLTHPATPEILEAARAMIDLCESAGVDVSDIANQYAIQRSGSPVTLVGTASSHHLNAAVGAMTSEIDEALLAELLARRPVNRTWPSGLLENDGRTHSANAE